MTKMQGSPQTTARHADDGGRGLPCILVIGEAALAAALITQSIVKHLEQNLAVQSVEFMALHDETRLVLGHDGAELLMAGEVD